MRAGLVFCFRCRRRFGPGDPECPHCLLADQERGDSPLFVVRPSLPIRWFLAGVALRLGGVLLVSLAFLVPIWGFEPRGIELPDWVLAAALGLFLVGFVVPNAVRLRTARRAARSSEFRFHADRVEVVGDASSSEQRVVPLGTVRDAHVRRSPFLPGRGSVVIGLEGSDDLVIECVVRPEATAERIRRIAQAARTVA